MNILKYVIFFTIIVTTTHAHADAEQSTEAIEKRIKPVGRVNIAAPKTPVQAGTHAAASIDKPKKIYQAHCKACHESGLLGAPKFGVTSAWEIRVKQGLPVLVDHVVKGYKAMPAKGLCPECTDEDIKATVEYMLQEAKIKL